MARHSADTRPVFKRVNGVQWLCALLLNLIVVVLLCEVSDAKVFERCELAKVLRHKHALSLPEVANWVCIAQHSSGFNTETHASGHDGGSHGLFQISDVYWCSPPGKGSGCSLPCARLRDADLTDDVQCIRRIYDEHQGISGDGYTAWNAYSQFCRNGAKSYIEGCFPRAEMDKNFVPVAAKSNFLQVAAAFKKQAPSTFSSPSTHLSNFIPTSNNYDGLAKKRGKIYNRCELAQELYYKHKMPMEEIPTWVCIAEHESRFDTSAVGRLNTDGSADHGLFQISDLFWCSKDSYGSKACGLQCSKLLDEDITDDVRCIRRIHGEHTAISGDGFTAWTVYNQHCRNQQYQQVSTCFPQHQSKSGIASTQLNSVVGSTKSAHNHQFSYQATKPLTGKIYKRCELAQELYFIHKFPMQDIATWLCIAQHESNYNTAAVGRLNVDGSADHGLFQISDLYWCSNDSSSAGKACNIPCHKLLDSDITDDVRCIKMIYEEHTRISGDGYTAWTVYSGNCRNQRIEQIATCFDSAEIEKGRKGKSNENSVTIATKGSSSPPAGSGKIYKQCELAQELYFKHKMPMMEIPTWVCIAQHESSFNTAAVGRLNTDGSADHGLFQISDLYWCSHDSYGGKACNIPCNKLLDSDITDDVRCVRAIYEEHTRISGDGFNAWTVYKPHCRQQKLERIANCFNSTTLAKASETQKTINQPTSEVAPSGPRKVYKKCELAQELYFKHKMPMVEIPTWVCIAQHESSFNTAAVGRLNTDGSADHGLFQISDLYWCTHDSYGGKACNLPCNKLLDSDITDDVSCIRTIYEEHTEISGDGFNAWTVYKPHCRQQRVERIADCFNSTTLAKAAETPKITHRPSSEVAPSGPQKVYKKCELAQELYFKHKMPMDEIPTWVCIAQHESSFNTAAVGRLNTDGSADHGLFQISDLYWCTHDSYGGKACNIPCNKLLDSDITDDIRCVRLIYEEHTRISGDGFTAWTVYGPHCRNQQLEQIKSCFDSKVISMLSQVTSQQTVKSSHQSSAFVTKPPTQRNASAAFSSNPFLSSLSAGVKKQEIKTQTQETGKISISEPAMAATENNYNKNPFLQKISTASKIQLQETENFSVTEPAIVITTNNIQQNQYLQIVPAVYQPVKSTNLALTTKAPSTTTHQPHSTRKYVISESFRTTKKITEATTTAKPKPTSTTKKPTTMRTTTWKTTSTTKKPSTNWRTYSSTQSRTTTLPKTTTTKKPTTNWRASTAGITTIKTTTPRTTTTQKPKMTQTTRKLATIKKPTTVWWTPSSTIAPKTITTHKPTTKRTINQPQKLTPPIWWTPSSTATPKTTTTSKKSATTQTTTQQPKLTTITTKKPATVWWTPSSRATPKITTTQKLASKFTTTTTQRPSTTRTTTTTTEKPTTNWKTASATTTLPRTTSRTTTTKKPATIWWTPSSSTTKKPNLPKQAATTLKPTATRATSTTYKSSTTTTIKPTTNRKTLSATTTQKSTTTQRPSTTRTTTTTTKKPTTNWKTASATTTTLPKTTSTTSRTTTIKKPSTVWWTPSSSTTKKPNLPKQAATTPKPTATRATSTTITSKPTTNWRVSNSKIKATTSIKPTTTTQKTTQKAKTTIKQPTTDWRTTQTTAATTKKTTTTKRPTTIPDWQTTKTTKAKTTTKTPTTTTTTTNWQTTTIKATTKDWRTAQTTKSTTKKPTTTTTIKPTTVKSTTQRSVATTTTTTAKIATSATKNPFDHPFFKKYKEQWQAQAVTTTKPTKSTTL